MKYALIPALILLFSCGQPDTTETPSSEPEQTAFISCDSARALTDRYCQLLNGVMVVMDSIATLQEPDRTPTEIVHYEPCDCRDSLDGYRITLCDVSGYGNESKTTYISPDRIDSVVSAIDSFKTYKSKLIQAYEKSLDR